MPKEQQLQTKIIKELKARGAYVVKVVSATHSGVPDLLVCYQGRFYGFELKAGNNKATPLQLHNGKLIENAGGVFTVAYSLEDVLKYLEV